MKRIELANILSFLLLLRAGRKLPAYLIPGFHFHAISTVYIPVRNGKFSKNTTEFSLSCRIYIESVDRSGETLENRPKLREYNKS